MEVKPEQEKMTPLPTNIFCHHFLGMAPTQENKTTASKYSYLPTVQEVMTMVGTSKCGMLLLSDVKVIIFWTDSMMTWNDAKDMMTERMTIAMGSSLRFPAHSTSLPHSL